MAEAANNNPNNNPINNTNGFTEITHNNASQALPINILIKHLKDELPSVNPFRLDTALDGLVHNKSIHLNTHSIFDYLVPYSKTSKTTKPSKTQDIKLNNLFSSFPTGIIFYFINVYLSIFDGGIFKENMFNRLLSSNFTNQELIDEQKYTAYNCFQPFVMYNENFGNELLINHLRCFFGIQPCTKEFEAARERNLFFGFIKSGPITSGIKGFIAFLTQQVSSVGGHMNSFIIDKEKRIIIHFEPKGKGASVYKPFNLKKFIYRIVGKPYIPESTLINIINIYGVEYTFVDTKEMTMVQSPLLNFDIFCQTYSILAILIYILNIEKIREFQVGESRESSLIMTMFKNITYEDALKFRNFFYSNCNDDYMRILESQREKIESIGSDFNANSVESDFTTNSYNTGMSGGRSLKRIYKSRKTSRKVITKNKHKSRKALKMQNKK